MTFVPESALVLVCVLPEQRDLDIARLLGWYRIPLKNAPKVIDVDYLAFYQTSAFGIEHQWKIEFISPVRGHELVTRAELFINENDHKRANEEYFKIRLGPIEVLEKPILAGNWKRITFLYSTGELINKASSVNDLVVHSEDRQLLFRSLRERYNSIESKGIIEDQIPDDKIIFNALLQWMDIGANKNGN